MAASRERDKQALLEGSNDFYRLYGTMQAQPAGVYGTIQAQAPAGCAEHTTSDLIGPACRQEEIDNLSFQTKLNLRRTRRTLDFEVPNNRGGLRCLLLGFVIFFLAHICNAINILRESHHPLLLTPIFGCLLGLYLLYSFLKLYEHAAVHIDEEAYSIAHRIGKGKLWSWQTGGSTIHLLQAAVHETHETASNDNRSEPSRSFTVILCDSAVDHPLGEFENGVEAQWLASEINAALLSLASLRIGHVGHPSRSPLGMPAVTQRLPGPPAGPPHLTPYGNESPV